MQILLLLPMRKSRYLYSESCKNQGQILGKQTRKKHITSSKKGEINTDFVPGVDRFLPFNEIEVSCPLTIAKGDTDINSGDFHVLHGLHMRIFPGISEQMDLIQPLDKKNPAISNLWKVSSSFWQSVCFTQRW